jgi:hypothetical protein
MYWNSKLVGLDESMFIQTGRGIGVEMSYWFLPIKNFVDVLSIEIFLIKCPAGLTILGNCITVYSTVLVS